MTHVGLSKAFEFEELALDKDEAKMLADGISTVAAQYTVEVNPKVVAWAGLCGIIGAIYGPRFGAWRVRKAMEKKGNKEAQNTQQEPAQVVPFDPSRFGVN